MYNVHAMVQYLKFKNICSFKKCIKILIIVNNLYNLHLVISILKHFSNVDEVLFFSIKFRIYVFITEMILFKVNCVKMKHFLIIIYL